MSLLQVCFYELDIIDFAVIVAYGKFLCITVKHEHRLSWKMLGSQGVTAKAVPLLKDQLFSPCQHNWWSF